MESRNQILIALGQALFAIFGSCVKWLNEKDKRKQKVASLVTEVVSAAFAGVLVYCLYAWLGFNVYIAFAIAGIIGHQGAKGIDLLGKFIVKSSVLRDEAEKIEAEQKEKKK